MGASIDVMDKKDVHLIAAKSRQAIFERAHDTVVRVVEANANLRRVDVYAAVLVAGVTRIEQTTDFGGDDRVPAVPECTTKAHFSKAMAVERRGVEIANAAIPCRIDSFGSI